MTFTERGFCDDIAHVKVEGHWLGHLSSSSMQCKGEVVHFHFLELWDLDEFIRSISIHFGLTLNATILSAFSLQSLLKFCIFFKWLIKVMKRWNSFLLSNIYLVYHCRIYLIKFAIKHVTQNFYPNFNFDNCNENFLWLL